MNWLLYVLFLDTHVAVYDSQAAVSLMACFCEQGYNALHD
jgi:hypothetical protein